MFYFDFFIFWGYFQFKFSILREVSACHMGPKAVLFCLENFFWRPWMEHKKDDNIQMYGIGNPGAGFGHRHKNVAGLNQLMGSQRLKPPPLILNNWISKTQTSPSYS
jgi:hypothetical protein